MSEKMTFNEFYDWLQFDSPNAASHTKALSILRYVSPHAQDDYVMKFYQEYMAE